VHQVAGTHLIDHLFFVSTPLTDVHDHHAWDYSRIPVGRIRRHRHAPGDSCGPSIRGPHHGGRLGLTSRIVRLADLAASTTTTES
jgi:hypothetical protein